MQNENKPKNKSHPSLGKDERKANPKPPKNKLLKNNILYRRKNKPPYEGIGNHLICLNKILRYPFISDHAFYCINSADVLELMENLKVFGYQSSYDSEKQLLKILFTHNILYSRFDIRNHKYYGDISPLSKMLELRKNFDDDIDDDENIKKFHLECIKKVLKCMPSKIINYYIPDFGLLNERHFVPSPEGERHKVPSPIGELLETLKEYQYSIKFEKNILTITL